ncbi:phasin family protein [Candidatus Sororendozoicomonas aggregata]|uniref:phasin family protein n=1 Tax=Candidatus Sororendozoicomonas aggregata TaxID=3073239 RepID=UPI002ED6337F
MYEKLWLAGLGAYGRYERLGQEGKKLFEDLVEEGDDMRDELSDRFESAKQKTLDKLNDTIIKVRGTILPDSGDKKAAELVPQLEELTKAVKLLTEVQTGPLADEPKIEVKAAEKATKTTSASKRKPSASASA